MSGVTNCIQPTVTAALMTNYGYGRVRGWVFGAWGEASTDAHRINQARVEDFWPLLLEVASLQPHSQGRAKSREAQLASLVRRRLSITAVKQQAKLLLDRLQLLGDGAAAAAARRQRAVQLEQAAVREKRAQAVYLRQGVAVMRRGLGKLD